MKLLLNIACFLREGGQGGKLARMAAVPEQTILTVLCIECMQDKAALTRQNLSCIRPGVRTWRFATETARTDRRRRLTARPASGRRFASRISSLLPDRPETVGSARAAEHDAMSGWGLKGYAQWGLAMLTSLPIWAGGGVVVLFQFARKCGPLPLSLTAPCPSHYGIVFFCVAPRCDKSAEGCHAATASVRLRHGFPAT